MRPPPPHRTWIVGYLEDGDVGFVRTSLPGSVVALYGPQAILCVTPADAVVEASLRAGLTPWALPSRLYRDAPPVRAVADALRIVGATGDHDRGRRDARWVAGQVHRTWGGGRKLSVAS